MKIKNERFFITIRSFFEVYLVENRNCSPNTVKSYKDAINLYLDFLEEAKNIPITKASWNCFSRQFVQEFLTWLEEKRCCGKRTQQQRLTAIRSFIRYGGILDVCVVSVQADVEKIKLRKPPQKLVHWLTKEELATFLSQPDGTKRTGLRDMVFLILMYDTAARCQEMVDLKIQDLILDKTSPCVYLTGKGNKTRIVPLLPKTAEHLRSYLNKFHPECSRKLTDYVFYTYGGPQKRMSEDTVAAFVKKYGTSAKQVCPSIPDRVHPHMLRHTRAMHLYQDGVALTLISEFLGHAQIETTRVYAYADTEMKRKAIQKANSTTPQLKGVVVEHRDFEPLIKTYDRKNALFYLDPPYVGTEKYYSVGFGTEDHQRLANLLQNIQGRFILSYNDDPFIRGLYSWCSVERIVRNNTLAGNSDNKVPFAEVIIKNF